jgi:esterase/lipase
MVFSMRLSIVIAVAITTALAVAGLRNRRTGWRRQTSDDVLDALMLWADAQAMQRTANQPAMKALVNPVPPTFTENLSALHSAVGRTAQSIERDTSPSSVHQSQADPVHSETTTI